MSQKVGLIVFALFNRKINTLVTMLSKKLTKPSFHWKYYFNLGLYFFTKYNFDKEDQNISAM